MFQIQDPDIEGTMVYDNWVANHGGVSVSLNENPSFFH